MSGIRLTIANSFNNPFLNPSQVGSPLLLDSTIALYEMKSIYDRSPHGNHLIMNNLAFNDMGLVSDGIDGHNAATGVTEPSAFTVLCAMNVPTAPEQISQVFSSIAESGSPVSGCRIAITPAGVLAPSMGANPSVNSLDCGGGVGGWTVFATTFSDTGMTCLRMSGGWYSTPLTGERNYAVRPIVLGGGYLPPRSVGIKGQIGLFGIYDGAFSQSEMMTLIQKARAVMRERGAPL